MSLSQYLADHAINKGNSVWQRTRFAVVNRLKKFTLSFSDPSIKSVIFGSELEVPLSHDLNKILSFHPNYLKNLAEIGEITVGKYAGLTAVDIGANVGDTVAILRSTALFDIICIEGNPKFLPYLHINAAKFSNVTIVPCFVGADNKVISTNISTSKGTATVNSASEGEETVVEFKTLSTIVGSAKNVKLIKIDTDGHDNNIIRASLDVIKDHKPVIFFEYDPFFQELCEDHKGDEIFNTLLKLGYSMAIDFNNTGEYQQSFSVQDTAAISRFHRKYSGHQGKYYSDVAVFHADDIDLFEKVKELYKTSL